MHSTQLVFLHPLLYTLIYLGAKGIAIVAVYCCFVLDYITLGDLRKIYVKKRNERQKMRDEEARVREN